MFYVRKADYLSVNVNGIDSRFDEICIFIDVPID